MFFLFQMHSRDLIEAVKAMYRKEGNYEKIAKFLDLPANSVRFMVNNNYDKVKKKPGKRKILGVRDDNRIKREVKSVKNNGNRVTEKIINENLGLECSIRTVRTV